ncbi:Glycine cleavage system H protein [Bienertia sinuspersici]
MREHFIIPDDEVYDTLAQQHVGKCWRHYKHELKKTFFQPDKKTHEQHYDLLPSGHSRSDWIKLVDIKLSQIGKEARLLQCQVHTMGSNSYANLQAEYVSIKSQLCFVKMKAIYFLFTYFLVMEAEHGKKIGLVEAWERSHMRKDESFVEGTTTEDFLDDAKAKVESLKLANSSCSSVDVEHEAFHDLMYGGDILERPQGFGFGVKKSDVYGVRGLLRKEGSKKVKTRCVDFDVNVKKNEVLEKENRELSRKKR